MELQRFMWGGEGGWMDASLGNIHLDASKMKYPNHPFHPLKCCKIVLKHVYMLYSKNSVDGVDGLDTSFLKHPNGYSPGDDPSIHLWGVTRGLKGLCSPL